MFMRSAGMFMRMGVLVNVIMRVVVMHVIVGVMNMSVFVNVSVLKLVIMGGGVNVHLVGPAQTFT